MTYADTGPKLVERGYSAIPIKPGTKQPGHLYKGEPALMPEWTKFAKRLPTSFEVEHWQSTIPDFGIGLVMSSDQIGVDIDVDDSAIVEAIRLAVGPTPAVKAGQKGETRFYLGPGVESRSYNEYLPDPTQPCGYRRGRRLCDIIGPGRQTVLPPSVHPDTGLPYRWTGFAALDALDPDELPVITPETLDQIGEALRPFGYMPDFEVAPRSSVVMSESDNPFRALNDAALADLPAWVPKLNLYKLRPRNGGYVAVPDWRPSSTGRPIEKRGANLKIHPQGIVDFHDGEKRYTPINLVMAATSCSDGEAFQKLSEWLGRVPEMFDLQPRPTEIVDGHLIDIETGEVLDEPMPDGHPAKEDFPEGQLLVGGLVGDISEWIMRTSPKPIRLFAVAAALSCVGTLVSRRVYCGTPRSGTTLYLMTIAGTGAGKERPQEAVRQILDKVCVACARMHSAEPSSAAKLGVSLNERPANLQIIDEVDRILRKVGHKNASSQEAELLQAYCSIWGKGLGTYTPTGTTTRSDVYIKRPALGIYGATTFHAFYEQMRAKMVANGFLNRFLVLPKFKRVPKRKMIEAEDEVPRDIVDAATKLFNFGDAKSGDMGQTYRIQDPDNPPDIRCVDMTEAAQRIYAECEARDEERLEASDNDPMLEIWSRGAEMTKRIALIVACGRYAEFGLEGVIVDEPDMIFAKRLVDWSLSLFIAGLRENMAENDHQANAKSVLNYIRKGGKEGVSRRDLTRHLDGRLLAKDIDAVIRLLADGDSIEARILPSSGGRPKTIYRAV